MRRMLLAIIALLGLAGVLVWWRSRRRSQAPPAVQIGYEDGTTTVLPARDPAGAGVLAAAADVRRAFGPDA